MSLFFFLFPASLFFSFELTYIIGYSACLDFRQGAPLRTILEVRARLPKADPYLLLGISVVRNVELLQPAELGQALPHLGRFCSHFEMVCLAIPIPAPSTRNCSPFSTGSATTPLPELSGCSLMISFIHYIRFHNI